MLSAQTTQELRINPAKRELYWSSASNHIVSTLEIGETMTTDVGLGTYVRLGDVLTCRQTPNGRYCKQVRMSAP